MKIKVVCTCGKIFDWICGKQRMNCPHCNKLQSIMNVKIAMEELVRLFE